MYSRIDGTGSDPASAGSHIRAASRDPSESGIHVFSISRTGRGRAGRTLIGGSRWRAVASGPVEPGDLDPDPIVQLDAWLGEARAAGVAEPEAMTLATAAPGG